jgi:hypothetical protein
MAIARWSPSQELINLHTTMDRLFSDWFQNPQDLGSATSLTFRLPVDVAESRRKANSRLPVSQTADSKRVAGAARHQLALEA